VTAYTVSWSIDIDDETPRGAALLAAGWIEDAIKNDGGANVLVVRHENGDHAGTFDEWGHGREFDRGGLVVEGREADHVGDTEG
jgi:hypothetical protein